MDYSWLCWKFVFLLSFTNIIICSFQKIVFDLHKHRFRPQIGEVESDEQSKVRQQWHSSSLSRKTRHIHFDSKENFVQNLQSHDDFRKEDEVVYKNATQESFLEFMGMDEKQFRILITNFTKLDEVDEEIKSSDYGSSYVLPILKLMKYDNNTIPNLFMDVPVHVRFKLSIIHLANFDSQLMEYTIDLEMEMRWFDLRLANNYSKPILIREMPVIEQIWTPDPYFVNSKYSYFHKVSFPNFRMRISPNGLVVYTQRVTLQPACQMIFCLFPHDRQECDLQISSIAYPTWSVQFSWNTNESVRFVNPVTLPELRINSIQTQQCQVEGKLIRSSCLRLVFNLERDGMNFVIEKYIPSTLAMMFAWVAPYVPYTYQEVRIITPITVLLTLVQMEKGERQIRTSYLTSMDIWFSAMKAFSVISLIESITVLALIRRSRTMARRSAKAISQLEKMTFNDAEKRYSKLYHYLDGIARLFSPIFFILFLSYYFSFITKGDAVKCRREDILK